MEQPINHSFNSAIFIDDNLYTNEYHKIIASQLNVAQGINFFTEPEKALIYLSDIVSPSAFPELIVVDINMPSMDGHELVSEIKGLKIYEEAKTCISYVTSSKDYNDALVADQLGVDLLYWKPLDDKLMADLMREAEEIIKQAVQ